MTLTERRFVNVETLHRCKICGSTYSEPSKLFKSGDPKLSWSEILSSIAVVDLKHTKGPNP